MPPHSAMPRPRGEPLYALAMIVAGWIAMRAVMVGAVDDHAAVDAEKHLPARHGDHRPARIKAPATATASSSRVLAAPHSLVPSPPPHDPFLAPQAVGGGVVPMPPMLAEPIVPVSSGRAAQEPAERKPAPPSPMHLAGGHQLLLLAGLSYIDLPDAFRPALAASTPPATPPANSPAAADRATSRWSGGGWLLLRRGQSAAALATGASSYGGSQFGAVIRYHLAPASALRPQAYLRVSGAINAPFRDRQAALGLALRPAARVPVALLAEARTQQGTSSTRLRPAVALISEIPPVRLPLGAEGEVYGQVGWVGGRDATGFFDLQATADRKVLRSNDKFELRAGGGVWSGGQRGAARLDAGPRITVRGTVAGTPSRLAMDWRFRVAGKAEPGSGPALTFSAGF